jgi:hypothetical protein
MRKNIVLITLMLSIFVFSLQIAEPVAAVKVVDHGTKVTYDNDLGWMKIVWKTYQYNNNYLKMHVKYYFKQNGKYVLDESDNITLAKITKSKIKITINALSVDNIGGKPGVTYRKTELNAAHYYWREFRSETI